MDQPDLRLNPDPSVPLGVFRHAFGRHRLHRPYPDRPCLSRRVQQPALADARQPRHQGRGRARRDRRRGGPGRRVRRRAPAGRTGGQHRAHRAAARGLADQRIGHVGRSPMRVRPDGDRHRGEGDHRRQHGRVHRRRGRQHQPGADAEDERRTRPRTDRDAQGDLHADAADRRNRRQPLRHRP